VFNAVEPVADHDSIYPARRSGRKRLGGRPRAEAPAPAARVRGTRAVHVRRSGTSPRCRSTAGSGHRLRSTRGPAPWRTSRLAGVATGTVAVGGYHTLRWSSPGGHRRPHLRGRRPRDRSRPGAARWPVERPSALIAAWAAPGQSYVSATASPGTTSRRSPASRRPTSVSRPLWTSAAPGTRSHEGGGRRRRRAPRRRRGRRWRLTDPAFSSRQCDRRAQVRDARERCSRSAACRPSWWVRAAPGASGQSGRPAPTPSPAGPTTWPATGTGGKLGGPARARLRAVRRASAATGSRAGGPPPVPGRRDRSHARAAHRSLRRSYALAAFGVPAIG